MARVAVLEDNLKRAMETIDIQKNMLEKVRDNQAKMQEQMSRESQKAAEAVHEAKIDKDAMMKDRQVIMQAVQKAEEDRQSMKEDRQAMLELMYKLD